LRLLLLVLGLVIGVVEEAADVVDVAVKEDVMQEHAELTAETTLPVQCL
jgi:hypothetical protein